MPSHKGIGSRNNKVRDGSLLAQSDEALINFAMRAINPTSPHLNGKVERNHLTDKTEFYQLLTYTGDRKLDKQLAEWEKFYNFYRPHGGLRGKTPYEILKKKLTS